MLAFSLPTQDIQAHNVVSQNLNTVSEAISLYIVNIITDPHRSPSWLGVRYPAPVYNHNGVLRHGQYNPYANELGQHELRCRDDLHHTRACRIHGAPGGTKLPLGSRAQNLLAKLTPQPTLHSKPCFPFPNHPLHPIPTPLLNTKPKLKPIILSNQSNAA